MLYHPNLRTFLIDPETGLNTKSQVVLDQKANPTWDVKTGLDYVPEYLSGYQLTEEYQYESRIIDLGGNERITSYFYYTDNFEQRNHIINYAGEFAKKLQKDENSNITIKTRDYLESITASFSSITNTFSTILLAFAFVSILISVILTAILTYISVVERKREIGLLRSLGARQRDISYMFIVEAIIIGVVAGLLGIALCYSLSPLVSRIVVRLIGMAGINMYSPDPSQFAQVQFWLIPVLFVGAIIIGVISSLVPAIIAGHKKPADALKE